jgi:hypothetical protein
METVKEITAKLCLILKRTLVPRSRKLEKFNQNFKYKFLQILELNCLPSLRNLTKTWEV